MKSLQQWSDYERDMRLAMILVADGMMNMLGTAPNAKTSAEAFLGIQLPSDFSGFLVNLVADPWGKPDAFLSQITLEGTHLYRTVRRAHDLLTAMKPIHQIGHQDERDEAIDWVGYFLTTVPTDSYGMGADYFDIVETQSNPLPFLHRAGNVYLSLIEFVHGTVGSHKDWASSSDMIVFNADDLALLGDVDIRSVRNAMGPSGSKPIRSFKALPTDRDDERAYANPVDALDWLSGRRGFKCGRLDADWVNAGIPSTGSLAALGAVAGMMFWLNGQTTEKMAEKLGWDVGQTRAWTRGEGLDPFAAKRVAEAAGLDSKEYSKQIAKLLKKEN
ncbi:hypothetical protein [Rhizobium sp. Pop5]|uniref:hypothetical protein n=2 Tax=Rhizobium sp. Pop5 TaxID=1223565 RepID=UPI000283A1CC|nr:hypothetical protein [Rhizobium sp. Pop5]EJZ17290.1 hypothetical protein RCCGEPOP_31506 [Rhizobium sp. Pop5]